jgi:hypothetical protein
LALKLKLQGPPAAAGRRDVPSVALQIPVLDLPPEIGRFLLPEMVSV